ncbi:MAG: hypothetical protein ACREP0_02145 [Rhodanobacteraceae bacterium]
MSRDRAVAADQTEWAQDVRASGGAIKNSHEADTLSRNCQLPEGECAMLQPNRLIDILERALRRLFEAQQERWN